MLVRVLCSGSSAVGSSGVGWLAFVSSSASSGFLLVRLGLLPTWAFRTKLLTRRPGVAVVVVVVVMLVVVVVVVVVVSVWGRLLRGGGGGVMEMLNMLLPKCVSLLKSSLGRGVVVGVVVVGVVVVVIEAIVVVVVVVIL